MGLQAVLIDFAWRGCRPGGLGALTFCSGQIGGPGSKRAQTVGNIMYMYMHIHIHAYVHTGVNVSVFGYVTAQKM